MRALAFCLSLLLVLPAAAQTYSGGGAAGGGMATNASNASLPSATRNLGLQYTVKSGGSIQTALTNAASAGGAVVYLQAGTYTITSPLIISSGTSLICEKGASIVATSVGWVDPNPDPINGAHNVAILNVNHGNYNNVNDPIVDHDITVEGCQFYEAGTFPTNSVFRAIEFRKAANVLIRSNDFRSGAGATGLLATDNTVVADNNLGTRAIGQTHSNTTIDNLNTTIGVQVGDPVNGPGIPASTTVAAIPTSTSITLSQAATSTSASVTKTGNTHTSATIDGLANTTGIIVGMYVSGSGISSDTLVVAIPSGTSVTLSQPTTSTVASTSVTFAGVPLAIGAASNACWDHWEGPKNFTVRNNTCVASFYGVLASGGDTNDTVGLFAQGGSITGNYIYMSGTNTQNGIWINGPSAGGSNPAGASFITVSQNYVSGDANANFGCWRSSGASIDNQFINNTCRVTGTNSAGGSLNADTGGATQNSLLAYNVYDNVQVQVGNVAMDVLAGNGNRAIGERMIGGNYPSCVYMSSTSNVADGISCDAGTSAKYNLTGATLYSIRDIDVATGLVSYRTASKNIAVQDPTSVAAGVGGQLLLQGNNNSAAQATYAAIKASAVSGGAGAEAGSLLLQSVSGGAPVTVMTLSNTGNATIAGAGNLALGTGAVTDNGASPTGTAGSGYVRATSPTLTTPNIGVATATTVNKWTFTAPTTAATLTAGADNLTYTGPAASTTLVGTGTTQTLAAKTLDGTNIIQQAHEDSFTSSTSTSFATITNLDQTFVAAGKYSCNGHMHFTTAPTTSNGVKLQLASDGTSSITTLNFTAIGFNGAAFATTGTGTATALGATAIAATQAFTDIILQAEIVINVGGVIHVQFNENATSGTIAGNARWDCLRAS